MGPQRQNVDSPTPSAAVIAIQAASLHHVARHFARAREEGRPKAIRRGLNWSIGA